MKNKIKIQKKEIYNLAKSFFYAFRGLKFAIDNERNMRIHLVASFFVIQFAYFYKLKNFQWIYILITMGLVIAAELINTAIEALVDMQTQSYTNLARIAKDVAAGAVVILAILSVIIAILTFNDIKKVFDVIDMIRSNMIYLSAFILEVIASILFIFNWNKRSFLK